MPNVQSRHGRVGCENGNCGGMIERSLVHNGRRRCQREWWLRCGDHLCGGSNCGIIREVRYSVGIHMQ